MVSERGVGNRSEHVSPLEISPKNGERNSRRRKTKYRQKYMNVNSEEGEEWMGGEEELGEENMFDEVYDSPASLEVESRSVEGTALTSSESYRRGDGSHGDGGGRLNELMCEGSSELALKGPNLAPDCVICMSEQASVCHSSFLYTSYDNEK